MKIRFTYVNRRNKTIESMYLTVNEFETNSDTYKRVELEIFNKLYNESTYNDDIHIVNYFILK